MFFWYVFDQLWSSEFKGRGIHNHFVPRARPFSVISGGMSDFAAATAACHGYRNAYAVHDLMVGLKNRRADLRLFLRNIIGSTIILKFSLFQALSRKIQ